LEEAGYSVLLMEWDMIVGSNWVAAMERGMAKSDRTIAVLSAAYLRSEFGRMEWQAAHERDPNGLARKLVPVRIEDCHPSGTLGQIVSLTLFGRSAEEARDYLLSQVSIVRNGRATPTVAPSFPGAGGALDVVTLAGAADDQAGVDGPRTAVVPLGTVRGHLDGLRSVCFSPDGVSLLTAGLDDLVLRWTVSDLRAPKRVARRNGPIVAVDVAPSGGLAATAHRDGTIGLWDVAAEPAGGPLVETAAGRGAPSSLAFHPSGELLVTAGVGGAILFDVRDVRQGRIRQARSLSHFGARIDAVGFSPDGRLLATGDGRNGGSAVVWDIHDHGHPTRVAVCHHTDAVVAVAFSPDSLVLATGSTDQTAALWSVREPGEPYARLTDHRDRVEAVAFSPDGRFLATGGRDRTVGIFDLTDMRQPARAATITGELGEVTAVVFAPDSRMLAIASGQGSLWRINVS